jgi:uncharacterized protein (UPF0297 family)
MKFIVIKNSDRGNLCAIVLQDSHGKLFFKAYNKWVAQVLGVLLMGAGFFIEEKPNNRTIIRRRIQKEDPRYFDVLKTKIPTPFAPYMSGTIQARTPDEALSRLWVMFSPKDNTETVEV